MFRRQTFSRIAFDLKTIPQLSGQWGHVPFVDSSSRSREQFCEHFDYVAGQFESLRLVERLVNLAANLSLSMPSAMFSAYDLHRHWE